MTPSRVVCPPLPVFVYDVFLGMSLAASWLRLCSFAARGLGSIPGWGTEIPQKPQRKMAFLAQSHSCFALQHKGRACDGRLVAAVPETHAARVPRPAPSVWQHCGPQSLWRRAGSRTAVGWSPSLLPGAGLRCWQEVRRKLGVQTAFPTSWKDLLQMLRAGGDLKAECFHQKRVLERVSYCSVCLYNTGLCRPKL